VCGVDISEPMVAIAKKRCDGRPWAEFQTADATRLPYPDHHFHAAASTQVYEYLPDIPTALRELHRVLRPGGRALILDTDYGSLVIHTEDAPRMARALSAWDEHFAHASLPRTLSRQLREAGFAVRHRSAIPMFNPEFRDNTYGKGLLALMSVPKQHYYVISKLGRRLVDLRLGKVALGWLGVSGREERLIVESLMEEFPATWRTEWLRMKAPPSWCGYFSNLQVPQEETTCANV
jgi:SAM-dependent methyltransferase